MKEILANGKIKYYILKIIKSNAVVNKSNNAMNDECVRANKKSITPTRKRVNKKKIRNQRMSKKRNDAQMDNRDELTCPKKMRGRNRGRLQTTHQSYPTTSIQRAPNINLTQQVVLISCTRIT